MGQQLTPEQIANWRAIFPLYSDRDAQRMRDEMQAEIDRLNKCDVRGCGEPREGHGHQDHEFMEPPLK